MNARKNGMRFVSVLSRWADFMHLTCNRREMQENVLLFFLFGFCKFVGVFQQINLVPASAIVTDSISLIHVHKATLQILVGGRL